MLLYGEKIKTSVRIHGGGLLDFVKLMYRNSHDVLPARPRFEVGEAVRTRSESDRGINFVGKQTRYRVFGLVLLALVFMQFPALATTTSVTLAWNPSTDSTIAGYNIYYGGASHTYTNKISVGKATSVTISGLVQGTTYYFAATTYAASGTNSPLSSEASYLIPMNVPIVVPTVIYSNVYAAIVYTNPPSHTNFVFTGFWIYYPPSGVWTLQSSSNLMTWFDYGTGTNAVYIPKIGGNWFFRFKSS